MQKDTFPRSQAHIRDYGVGTRHGCENTAIKSLNNLQYVGLITKERQKRGLPLKIYVKNIMKDNYSKADYPTAKDVSFDIEKAMMTAKTNRKNFAEKRNKRRTS